MVLNLKKIKLTKGSDVNKCMMRKSGFFIFNNLTNGKKFKKNIYSRYNLDLKKPTLFVSKFRFDNFSILILYFLKIENQCL